MEKKFHINKSEELDSDTIYIDGNVDENSIIQAVKLKIDGHTKTSSTQFARYAKIKQHSGNLRCSEAIIHTLDNGSINATKIDIHTSNGGHLYAQDINIYNVKENTTIIASNNINIKNLESKDTTIIIDYEKIPVLVSKLELIDEDLKELNLKLQNAKQHNIPKIEQIEKSIATLLKEKKFILHSTDTAKLHIENSTQNTNKIIFIKNHIETVVNIKKGNNITISM